MEFDSLSHCCVCDQLYSDSRIPRNLRCGHSVCSLCVEEIIRINKFCPECRSKFEEDSSVQLPINYPLLRLCRLFAFGKGEDNSHTLSVEISVPSCESEQNVGQCPLHPNCVLFFVCMRCLAFVCRECLATDHPDPPRGRCFILSIGEAIEKIKRTHYRTLVVYSHKAKVLRDEFVRTTRLLERILKYLENSLGSNEHIKPECLLELEKLRETRETVLLTLDDVSTSLEEMKNKFHDTNSPQEILALFKRSSDCQLAFEEQKEKLGTPEISSFLNIIFGRGKTLREFLEDGNEVYGVSEEEKIGSEEKEIRWSPVRCIDGRLHLYSLRKESLPSAGLKLPYDILRMLVPTTSPAVFFEVGWKGDVKGHVYTRMFGNTPRSCQTVFLCSGEKGPSYRNTCFFKHTSEEGYAESLCGGDYENNDGTGGRAIVTGIVSGLPYVHKVKAGLYVSWPAYETYRLAQFDIYLEDSAYLEDHSAHGIVEEGLDILKRATTVDPLTDASVMDCGLIIP